jgi:hypothetical protein
MRKRIVLLTILTAFGIIFFLNDFSMAQKNIDLFDEILKITNGNTIEYGVTATFTIENNHEDISDNILKDLGFYNGLNKKTLNNQRGYCLEFGKDNVNGYIENIRYENYSVVTVNIIKEDNKNNLKDLQNKLQQCFKDHNINAKYFEYLKAKVADNGIENINKEILTLLKNHKATNVNTIQLENGYSTTAYTKIYDSIQSDSKTIDFNYAICKYSSGSYIIIGTPEIIVTY